MNEEEREKRRHLPPLHPSEIAMSLPDDADNANWDILDLRCETQIVEFIAYREFDLARLVEEILIAQGYRTEASPFGDAGSIYILAKGGRGPFGFVLPSIGVLVRSINQMDDPDIDELKSLQSLDLPADVLFASWLQFSDATKREAGRLFKQTQFWNVTLIIAAIEAIYDKLPSDLKACLPLKKIWILDRDRISSPP